MQKLKINGKIRARFLVTVLVLSRLIGGTVQALERKTAANGQQYLREIRDQDHPISFDEIRRGNGKELGGVSSLIRNSGALMSKVQSQPILSSQRNPDWRFGFGFSMDELIVVTQAEYKGVKKEVRKNEQTSNEISYCSGFDSCNDYIDHTCECGREFWSG